MATHYSYKKGTKLMIELIHGQKYGGTVSECQSNSVTLVKLYQYPSEVEGKHFFDYTFYKVDIRNITVLQEVIEPKLEETLLPYHKIHYRAIEAMANKYTYIHSVDDTYKAAVKSIQSCLTVSVIGLSNMLSRTSGLYLLSIHANDHVYIFDIKLIGEIAFEDGLSYILQTGEIRKVVHNCMVLSDLLYCNYNVILANAFDTQLADLKLIRRDTGVMPNEMRTLKDCLKIRFEVPDDFIDLMFHRYNIMSMSTRPLQGKIKSCVALQTVYLMHLKLYLEKKILYQFHEAVDTYTNCMKDVGLTASWRLNKNTVSPSLEALFAKMNISKNDSSTDASKDADPGSDSSF